MRLVANQQFIDLLKTVERVCEEPVFWPMDDVLFITGLNESRSVYVSLMLMKGFFEQYETAVNHDVIGVDLKQLLKHLKTVKKDSSISFELDRGKAEFRINVEKSGSLRSFNFPITWKEAPKEIKLNLTTKAKLSVELLDTLVDDVIQFDNVAKITLEQDSMAVETARNISSYRALVRKGDALREIGGQTPVSAWYSFRLMKTVVDGLTPIAEETEIEMAENMPLRFSTNLAAGNIVHVIAPFQQE